MRTLTVLLLTAPLCAAFVAPVRGRAACLGKWAPTRGPSRIIVDPSSTAVAASDADDSSAPSYSDESEELVAERAKLRKASLMLWRFAGASWWCQFVLSVISGVTLFFASSVSADAGKALATGLLFSSAGLLLSFCSILLTWGLSRLATDIRLRKVDGPTALERLKKKCETALLVNVLGMGVTIVSSEQIVGLLISRFLSMQGGGGLGLAGGLGGLAVTNLFRPLDVFTVQANTNLMAAHFISLAANLFISRRIPRYL